MTIFHHLLALLLLPLLAVYAADVSDVVTPLFDSKGVPLPVPVSVSPVSNFKLPPAVPSKFEPTINTICFAAPAPKLCGKIAIPYADRSPISTITPKDVLNFLFQGTADSTFGVYAKAGRLTSSQYLGPNDIANLKQCQSGFTNALHGIAAAKAAAAAGKGADALASLAVATKDIKGCDDVYAQKADAMSPLTDNTGLLVSLINNLNAMVNKVLGKA